jgi:8-hydroxy-5-deazaflavin:NADPH oxidoreductase
MAKEIIAIIGATGILGSAMAKNLAKGKYRLLLFGHDETLEVLAAEIRSCNPSADVDCLSCIVDASWEADIIISAVPAGTEKQIAEKIKQVATQKIVIAITNSPDLSNASGNIDSAGELQRLLPDSKVAKALLATPVANFIRLVTDGGQIDSLITGNDQDALRAAKKIITTAGFHPVMPVEYAG